MSDSGWNMYVFRDGQKQIRGLELRSALVAALQRSENEGSDDERLLEALIAAGELECAIADASCEDLGDAEAISDAIARAFVAGNAESLTSVAAEAIALKAPEECTISVHEGFAYYALHPTKFVNAINALVVDGTLSNIKHVGVIGIRSIGAPLSAVAKATLEANGLEASRITVRPDGHPYSRALASEALRTFVAQSLAGKYIVVDEGPGMSGSSFLSVAEALVELGVAHSDIVLIGTRETDGRDLRASEGAERWSKFRFVCVQIPPVHPSTAAVPMSGGTWRRMLLAPDVEIPSSWPTLELCKFLSYDREHVFKFQGYGHFGRAVAERARMMHEHGFGAPYVGSELGFGLYKLVKGRAMRTGDLSSEMIERIGKYCAFRAQSMGTSASPRLDTLQEMAQTNWQLEFRDEEFGDRVPFDGGELICTRAIIADGRMMPHEWLLPEDGSPSQAMKLDAVNHGDDHFFPGPCDIAWDLAGAIVEWEMSKEQQCELLSAYERHSGDDVSARLHNWLLAYSVFRMGWCKMAARACAGQFDEETLTRDYLRYREWIVKTFAPESVLERNVSTPLSESAPVGTAEVIPAA